jgi:uncharacterized protein
MPRATLSVRVQPRARSETLVGLREGVIVVRVAAPPLDGRANDAVCRLLAGAIGVRANALTILRGERARDKVIAVDGVDQATAEAAIRAAIDGSSGA